MTFEGDTLYDGVDIDGHDLVVNDASPAGLHVFLYRDERDADGPVVILNRRTVTRLAADLVAWLAETGDSA